MIFLDSCILIYALEDSSERGDRVRARLAATKEVLAVSPLVLHECLVGPLRAGNIELRQRYSDAYARLHEFALDAASYVRAAELRAMHGLRTPDALHLAAAQRAECSALWTNDRRFVKASAGLAVDILES